MPIWVLVVVMACGPSALVMQLVRLGAGGIGADGRRLAAEAAATSGELINVDAIDLCTGSACGDKAKINLYYELNVPKGWWANGTRDAVKETRPGQQRTTHHSAMMALHGNNVWKDPRVKQFISQLGVVAEKEPVGSPIDESKLTTLVRNRKPKIFLEVGVFHGATSMKIARLFDQMGLKNSFVISMDTWLLDLRFVWSQQAKSSHNQYFSNVEVGGSSQMYFTFLANCIEANVTHRIVPLQTASSNGAMALLAHHIRPDLMYLDASHAAPDVFIDFENFYQILAPGGMMVLDDVGLAIPDAALKVLAKRYNVHYQYFYTGTRRQAQIRKPLTAT